MKSKLRKEKLSKPLTIKADFLNVDVYMFIYSLIHTVAFEKQMKKVMD